MSAKVQGEIQSKFLKLPAIIRDTILNTSVRLSGQATKGQFTGSGVILHTDNQFAYVVTAKHNLYAFNDQKNPPTWNSNLIASFQAKVKINYAGGMAFGGEPGQTADINQIQPVDVAPPPSWLYDVMILKSKDPGLISFAKKKTNNVFPVPTAKQGVVLNPNQYLKKGNQTYFIQTGYGANHDTAPDDKTILPVDRPFGSKSQTLQYRFTEPIYEQTTTVFNQVSTKEKPPPAPTYYQFLDAIQLKADVNDSTAPGDSGGPLFLVKFEDKDKSWYLFLIGVTTGTDMAASPDPCPKPPALIENNIVTSLQFCYANNFNFG